MYSCFRWRIWWQGIAHIFVNNSDSISSSKVTTHNEMCLVNVVSTNKVQSYVTVCLYVSKLTQMDLMKSSWSVTKISD